MTWARKETTMNAGSAPGKDDPPPAQRTMSARAGSDVTEVAASHSVYVSQPAAVAAVIKQAASAVATRQ
jgi:hypothetical protein